MHKNELIHKIRNLKILELVVRYGYSYDYVKKNSSIMQIKADSLVWNKFFDIQNNSNKKQKSHYTLSELEYMDKESLKQVIEEFWFYVYYQIYEEKGMPMFETVNPDLLAYLDLPLNANITIVKKRFRELCKKYHPDCSGNSAKFIELMEMAEKYDL